MLLASAYPAGWKGSSFLSPCALIGHLPQALQGAHRAGSQLFPHRRVADVGVEDGDDGDLLQVSRGNAVGDAPEPLAVVA